MAIIGIVAIDHNNAIGKDGKLPWHYSADMRFFKETTLGNTVLMGANTWRSIGRPLPGRQNIVLSRSGKLELPDGVMLFNNKAAALEAAQAGHTDLFVIGGAAIFKEFAHDLEQWIVTEVPLTVGDADVFMPE